MKTAYFGFIEFIFLLQMNGKMRFSFRFSH